MFIACVIHIKKNLLKVLQHMLQFLKISLKFSVVYALLNIKKIKAFSCFYNC